MSDSFSFEVEMEGDLTHSIEKLTLALKEVGFGVLTRIDVNEVLKTKINADFRPYSILGVCNPHLAHRALQQNAEVGLMLPCPVTIEKKDDNTTLIRVGNPDVFIQFGDFANDPVLTQVAAEAKEKLEKAISALQS